MPVRRVRSVNAIDFRLVENPTSPSNPLTPDPGSGPSIDPKRSAEPAAPSPRLDSPWLPPLAPAAAEPTVVDPAEPPITLYDADVYDPEPPYAVSDPVAPDRPRRRRGLRFVGFVLASALGTVAAVGALLITGVLERPQTVIETAPSTPPVTTRQIVTGIGQGTSPAAVGAKVTPSIVTVEVGTLSDGQFATFGSGSGVVLTADGLIATNHHVIEDSSATQVVFQDGSIYRATLVGSDPLTDLAVLRIDSTSLIPIELGATSVLSIGDTAIAIGNPLGQRGGASLTVGVVSAFNRDVEVAVDNRLFGMIQTDAPITQGSSGGALVDGNGRLIGITTAIGVSSAGAEGIGYAIPVELMTRITDEIIATGAVRHPFLGVELRDSFSDTAGVLRPNGAIVTGFINNETSAARDAGVEPGDIVIDFEARPVRTLDDLVNGLRLYRVGDVVAVEVMRDGRRVIIDVTLGERPDNL